ncbi:MAG: YceI family protein [Deltaproteobacteria bacterium]|nr:YceI family protein [Deltaproteobacteria bacterium]
MSFSPWSLFANLALAASLTLSTGALWASALTERAVGGDELEIDRASSVFAVVTHKAGAAARLAHDHLIVARGYSAELRYHPAHPMEASFVFEAPVTSLEIDSPQAQETWFPRLQELGILDQAFGEMSDKNRAKVRSAMLGPSQLDAERFPTLSVQVRELRASADGDRAQTSHQANVVFEIHGQEVEAPFPLRISTTETKVVFEAFGTLTLSDFGIKPYSALLGAVRNRDQVDVFLYLEATPKPPIPDS